MLPTPERYAEMLDGAAAGGYAFPAINVTSSQTLNAAMRGFAEADSDGIVQITVGGARYLGGDAPARARRRIPAPAAGGLARARRARRAAAVSLAHVRRLHAAAGREPARLRRA